ncbi:MAG: hypothetical protein KF863_21350 [Rubrivivax sp.]|nr:hypothetical protein [Rubrivivax sp.]
MRTRHVYMIGGSLAVLGALYLTDPDRGLTTSMLLLALVTPLLAVAFSHWSRKALHDYPEADMRSLFRRAGESPVGAGLALVALSIVVAALLGLFGRAAHAQPQPHARALALAPVLVAEIDRHWPDLPQRAYVPALISHESCISYTHSRCWSPTSRLRTQREEGAGMGQLTRAWHPDGRLRFDALAELRDRHPALRDLDWATIYGRPDLQVRAIVLMSRDNWRALAPVAAPLERLAMADAAYNGGLGGLQRERRACQVAAGCDPGRWWGHVEHRCLKSRAPLYAGRSPCDINRHHVVDVWARMPRYAGMMRGA